VEEEKPQAEELLGNRYGAQLHSAYNTPAHCAKPNRFAGRDDYPLRIIEIALYSAGNKNRIDNTHGLLGVIRSVGATEQSGRQDLIAAKMAFRLGRSEPLKTHWAF
jgi:hypothetical protein